MNFHFKISILIIKHLLKYNCFKYSNYKVILRLENVLNIWTHVNSYLISTNSLQYNNNFKLLRELVLCNNNVQSLKRLLQRNISLNIQDDYGWTLMHYAIIFGYVEIVKVLLDATAGDSCSIQSYSGWTPMQFATYHGHVEIVKMLLKANGGIHAVFPIKP